MWQKNLPWPLIALIALSCAFTLAGLTFAHNLGIEADEAIIASGIYGHGQPVYSWRTRSFQIPVMLMSYVGGLKAWIWNLYFLFCRPSAVTLRFPAILCGVAGLWLLFAFLDRVAGRLAAWTGTLLLASDPVYLLVETTDFGFVTLQFLLKLSAILLLIRFHRCGSSRALAGAFLLFGLALWDKAVFVWVLFGLASATICLFPNTLRKYLTKNNIAVAATAFALGALPLAIYNIARPMATLHANVGMPNAPISNKAEVLLQTIEGRVLFDFVNAPQPGPWHELPHNFLQSLSLRLATWLHSRRNLLILPALALAFAIGLLVRGARKPILFAFLTCGFTWLAMALTRGGGGGAQHTILLWPWHLFAIAVALAQFPLRISAPITAVLCFSNLMVANQYHADLIHNGPGIAWTDAVQPLEQYLSAFKAQQIFATDWGIFEPLNLLSEGTMPVYMGDADEPTALDRMISNPHHLFVAHLPDYTYQPQIRVQIESRARATGFDEERVSVIFDHYGRGIFEVFRFRENQVKRAAKTPI